jgi:hypothetical protein
VPNFKLVGAVAIKVRPDAKGFRRSTDRQVKEELKGYTADVKITAKVKADTTELKHEVEEAKKQVQAKKIQLKVGLDYDSVKAAQARLDAMLKPTKTIKVNLKDQGSIDKAQAKLDKLMRKAKVEMTIAQDDKGYQQVLDKIAAIRRQKTEIPISFHTDESSLAKEEAKYKALLAASSPTILVRLNYNRNKAGLEKAIAQIDEALAGIDAVKIDVHLNKAQLMAKRAELKAELRDQTITLDYDPNLAGLMGVKAEIEKLLGVGKLHIKTKLDEVSLAEALAKVKADIRKAELNKLRIQTVMNPGTYFKTLAAIKLLTKNQTIHIFTRLNNVGLLLAAAKLTGLRAAGRWTQEFARSLGTLDRNLPIVAGAVVGISTLASGVLTLTANIFSLGNGVGEVVRMAGLLAPAMILGLGASMIVMKGVFKDFGAAVNGDTKALKALAPAGREAAANVRTIFQAMRQTISANFWDKASDGMLRFTKTALPSVSAGLGGLATSLGGVFSNLLDSFTRMSQNGGIKVFFTNLNHGFDLAQTGLADFMDAFNTLAVVGSAAFPRIARSFNDFATRFDNWVNRLSADGTLQRWIDIGTQGMHDLFNIAGSLVKVWGNIGTAAQAAGALTLHSFSEMMARLDAITSGTRFQQNMKVIFQGAREASNSFHQALGSLGPAMDVFSVTVKNTLVGAGRALGSFIAVIGDVISSPRLNTGLTAFLGGVQQMFVSLRPAAADIVTILQTFGQILGQVATDSGPLFKNLFHELAGALTAAWAALEPFLPQLIQIGTTVVSILGPALASIAREVIPAFAQGRTDIGGGLLPIVGMMTDFAVGAAGFLASIPAPILAGIAVGIFSIGTSMAFVRTVLPLVTGALEAFGVTAAFTSARMQLLIPGVGILLAAATAVGAGALTAFAASQRNATPFANEYADALMADAKAAHSMGDAIGEATTKLALKKLVDSGAYEAAQKLGFGTQEVTDAVLKGGSAWDNIMKKVDEAKSNYANMADIQAATGDSSAELTDHLTNQNDAATILGRTIDDNRNSIDAGRHSNKLFSEVAKQAGINISNETGAVEDLWTAAMKSAKGLGEAAAATRVLTDRFSSSASKVDAMRKTLELLTPQDAAQKVAENLGEYVKGLNDIRESAISLKPQLQELGASIYGKNGFLNVATGNKAVMQLNQALVDEVNNVWSGAKAAYDAALDQGKNTVQAFNDAQQFVKDHKGDYNDLATASGVASDKVQGQWEKVFGKEWVLKVSLEGATEAAAKAQAMMTAIGQKFDGQRFQMFLDANPDRALQAITDADGAAKAFVNSEYKAKLDALPKPAQDAITALLNQTNKTWVEGDFQSILSVAKDVPGLAEAILKIMTGAGGDYQALIYAAVNNISLADAKRALDNLAARRRAYIDVVVNQLNTPDFVPRGGQRVPVANGGILDVNGRHVKQFANGGIERHVAQITKPGGPLRVWAEPETQGEAYLPYAKSKRPRSVAILAQVAKDFGYTINRAEQFVNGGLAGATTTAPSRTSQTSVTVGTINTVDPDGAVRKLRQLQHDALSVAGIN